MCKLKSMIVLKDRIYCPDHNNHQQMLNELGIEDNYLGASKTFVRVELSPDNDDITIPVDDWKINIDQDITPEWFDVCEYRERINKTVKDWAAEHIHTSGVVEEITAGIHFVGGSATIKTVGGSATIEWVVDSATIEWVVGSATIKTVSGSATIERVGGSATIVSSYICSWSNINKVAIGDNATIVDRYNKTIYQAGDGWTFVKAEEEVTTTT